MFFGGGFGFLCVCVGGQVKLNGGNAVSNRYLTSALAVPWGRHEMKMVRCTNKDNCWRHNFTGFELKGSQEITETELKKNLTES